VLENLTFISPLFDLYPGVIIKVIFTQALAKNLPILRVVLKSIEKEDFDGALAVIVDIVLS
jgi:hypothetical protein